VRAHRAQLLRLVLWCSSDGCECLVMRECCSRVKICMLGLTDDHSRTMLEQLYAGMHFLTGGVEVRARCGLLRNMFWLHDVCMLC
jgi:hypothetical protein